MARRIGLVAKFQWEGGRLWVENLGRCLVRVGSPFTLYYFTVNRASVHREIGQRSEVISIRGSRLPNRLQTGAQILQIVAHSRLRRLDAFVPWSLPSGTARRIGWIPDFQHRRLPDLFEPEVRRDRDRAFRRVVEKSDRVIVSSQAVAKDFAEFLGPSPKVRTLPFVTPLAENDFAADDEAAKWLATLPDSFAYIPNQLWIHKDHEAAIRAAGILKRRGVDIPMISTGSLKDRRLPEHADHLRRLVDSEEVDVRFLGHLPRSVQLRLYERARVLVQPSRFEGWNTSVEDARALGIPIVLSNIAVHMEQSPPHARYFETGNPESLAEQLAAVWQAPPQRPARAELIAAADERALAVGRRLCEIAFE